MKVNMKLTAAVLKALINAMKRRCAGFPLEYEIETTTIETAEEMLDTIERSLADPNLIAEARSTPDAF